ncbi:MAG TPA: hypothetical protein VIK91_17455 [Nannocystis sp.]
MLEARAIHGYDEFLDEVNLADLIGGEAHQADEEFVWNLCSRSSSKIGRSEETEQLHFPKTGAGCRGAGFQRPPRESDANNSSPNVPNKFVGKKFVWKRFVGKKFVGKRFVWKKLSTG